MLEIEYENVSELIGILREKDVFIYEQDGKLKYTQKDYKLTKNMLEILLENKDEIIDILRKEKEGKELIRTCKKNEFPLTEIQSAYLFGKGNVYEYGNVSCHVCMELIYPELDRKRVEEVWNMLIKRHSMLRTIFKTSATQYIMSAHPRFELFNKNRKESKDDIEELLCNKKYDSDKWPLFDIACFNENNQSTLLLSFDMMIADWRSIWILINEFELIYFGLGELKNNKYEFKDFVETQKHRKKYPDYYADKHYWESKREDILKIPKIEIIKGSGYKNKVEFKRYSYFLSKEKWEKIKLIEKKLGVTSSCTLMAIYSYTLAKYSEDKKFALNCTIMDREKYGEDFKNVVGDFTNILLLGVNYEEESTFIDYVRKLQLKLIKDLEHSLFSGMDVLREIKKQKTTRNILYPYVFTSSIGFNADNMIGKYTGKGLSQTPQVFIDCQVVDIDKNLYINWDIREGVFKEYLANEMFNLFVNMLLELENIESWEKILNVKSPSSKNDLVDEELSKETLPLSRNNLRLQYSDKNEKYIEVENFLISVWKNLLNKNINIDTDIFTAGADSLLIAQASSKFAKEYSERNSNFSISFDSLMRTMIENPIINKMATCIYSMILNKSSSEITEKNNLLGKIKFYRKGQRDNLIVIIHSGLGKVNRMEEFIDNLSFSTNQDVAAIEINNMKDFLKMPIEDLFKRLGKEYYNLIKDSGYNNIQLIGHCIGGMIACEVASELIKNDFNVIEVALIDSIPPKYQYNQKIITELLFIKTLGLSFSGISIIEFTEADLHEYLKYDLKEHDTEIEKSILKLNSISKKDRFRAYFNNEIEDDEELFLLHEVFNKNSEAALHDISPIVADIRLFIANKCEDVIPKDVDTVGKFWEKVCIGDFSTIEIEGDHNSCVENKKYSRLLAKKINEKWLE